MRIDVSGKVCQMLALVSKSFGIFLIIQCISISLQAKNYYFSSTEGNDNYTSEQAQNSSSPWRSISKLNSFFPNLSPGDSILFKRGNTFYGSIIAGKSGTSDMPIVFGAYGTGYRPIISGFATITDWKLKSTGIYEATLPGIKGNLNMVVMNNQPQAMGRYPNADAENGGYLKYESFFENNSITDNELTNSINWTGAEAVIRKKLWVLNRCRITKHSGTNITYLDSSGYDANNNYGYFIQDDPRTLDKPGEWYASKNSASFQMYFGSVDPSSVIVKVGMLDTLLNITAKSFITIENLSFHGANVKAVYSLNSNNIIIQNCEISYSGESAVFTSGVSDLVVQNVSTNYIQSNAFFITGMSSSNVTIKGCNVKNTGRIPGMGLNNSSSYKGIFVQMTENIKIEYNHVDTTGFCAIEFQGNNVSVNNNVINYCCDVKDNGAGIYTWASGSNSAPGPVYTNRVIKDNIVMNVVGAPDGRFSANLYDDGIFLDGRTMNVAVTGNTMFNIGRSGVNCNNPKNVSINNNTSFGNQTAVSFKQWVDQSISNLDIKQNIFFPTNSSQRNLFYTNDELASADTGSLKNALAALGKIDSNYYGTLNKIGFGYDGQTADTIQLATSMQSMKGWQIFSGQDKHASPPVKDVPDYQLKKITGTNKCSNGSFDNNLLGGTLFSTVAQAIWDNTNKISGGALRIDFLSATPNTYVKFYSPVGEVSQTKNYIFRFTTLGTTPYGIVKAYLRQARSPYTALTPSQTKTFGTSVQKHEFLFAAPVSDDNASFVIEIEQNSGTTYIDNVELFEADVNVFNQDDYLRFEYNSNTSSKTIALGADYYDITGKFYPGSITLQPFTSKILIKDTTFKKLPLVAKISATKIKCFGDLATVTVAAEGGIAPYKGTGTFTNLGAGTYIYMVADATGATSRCGIVIKQPDPLKVNIKATKIEKYGGTAIVSVTATGGTAPYKGAGKLKNIKAGTYSYTIVDSNGCSATATITIKQPNPELNITSTAPLITCFGRTSNVTIAANGGISPYTGTGIYTVSAGRGTLRVSFPQSIAGSYTSLYSTIGSIDSSKRYMLRFSTIGVATGSLRASLRLTQSPWTVITKKQTASFSTSRMDHEFIFDASSTVAAASYFIEINQNSGTVFIDNIAFFEIDAANNLTSANTVTNSNFETGINNVTYYSSNNNQTVSWDTANRINSVYYFTVKDAANTSKTIAVNADQPSYVKTNVTAANIDMIGGTTTVTVTATGGTPPYTGTGIFTNLKAGTYNYRVTDANGCTGTKSITITQPAAGKPTISRQGDIFYTGLSLKAYPNPSATSFNIVVSGGNAEKIEMLVTSADGKLIYKTNGNSNQNYSIGEKFATGVYIVQVAQGKEIKTIKLVKVQ